MSRPRMDIIYTARDLDFGLIDNYAVFKNLTDVDLANVSKVKAIGPALGHMIKLIAASPNPNISFQSFRVLMSFAKTLGNDETARLSDEIDSLQSTLNYVRELAGAKKSLATRQKKLVRTGQPRRVRSSKILRTVIPTAPTANSPAILRKRSRARQETAQLGSGSRKWEPNPPSKYRRG